MADGARQGIFDAIVQSKLAVHIGNNIDLINNIVEFMETKHIFFCSHKGCDLVAFNQDGEYLGTIVKAPDIQEAEDDEEAEDDQWLTGFDFDSRGALYVALYSGFLAKYPVPSTQSAYSASIEPRSKDAEFEKNMNAALLQHGFMEEADSLSPEGVVVLENDKYECVFVTCMDPVNGVVQFTLNGVLQRIICPNLLDGAWSLKLIPSFFTEHAKSTFMRNRNLLMVSVDNTLSIIDVDAGSNGNLMSGLACLKCQDTIGDFAFIDTNMYSQKRPDEKETECERKPLLLVNLQQGLFQFHQMEMFWMLKELDLKQLKLQETRNFTTFYGTCIGPDGDIYVSDHKLQCISKIHITDYAMILDENKMNEEMDSQQVTLETFVQGVDRPNYCKWFEAAAIGLSFVSFPEYVFE